jgi:hypothetical protein
MKRYFLAILFVGGVLLSTATALLPQGASAAPAFDPTTAPGAGTNSYINADRSTIVFGGKSYFDDRIDNDYTYVDKSDSDGCDDKINNLSNGNTTAQLHIITKDAATGKCNDKTSNISLADAANSTMPFDFVDNSTIQTSDQRTTYKLQTTGQYKGQFLEDGGDQCKDIIKVVTPPTSSSPAVLEVTASTKGDSTPYDHWSGQVDFNTTRPHFGSPCTTYGPQRFQDITYYFNSN